MSIIGIIFAFVAMLCWGFGDFLMQKSTRKLGSWETMFISTFIGAIILTPIVWKDIPLLLNDYKDLAILLLASAVLFIAAILDLEALRRGKLAIVESIWSLEIVSASFLAYIILHETISVFQIVIIVTLIVGLMLVANKESLSLKKVVIEKGVFIALIAALVMGGANFLFGIGARISSPIMINFVTDIFLLVGSFIFLFIRGRLLTTVNGLVTERKLLITMTILDKAAWIAFAFSLFYLPIAIATSLSESYIIIAVILGLAVNKEKLSSHQKFGLIVSLFAAITLAVTVSG